jgi:hypothetical protein
MMGRTQNGEIKRRRTVEVETDVQGQSDELQRNCTHVHCLSLALTGSGRVSGCARTSHLLLLGSSLGH